MQTREKLRTEFENYPIKLQKWQINISFQGVNWWDIGQL